MKVGMGVRVGVGEGEQFKPKKEKQMCLGFNNNHLMSLMKFYANKSYFYWNPLIFSFAICDDSRLAVKLTKYVYSVRVIFLPALIYTH